MKIVREISRSGESTGSYDLFFMRRIRFRGKRSKDNKATNY
jgi:hypothetical protein